MRVIDEEVGVSGLVRCYRYVVGNLLSLNFRFLGTVVDCSGKIYNDRRRS